MKTESNIFTQLDWWLLILYVGLVLFGWLNIYAVSYEQGLHHSVFDLSRSAGKQLLWIATSGILFTLVLLLETKLYQALAYTLYTCTLLLLIGTLAQGVHSGGHSAWLQWGHMRLQPSEFAKLTCALALAKYLNGIQGPLARTNYLPMLLVIILLPVALILLQGDMGSGIVFGALVLVLYREGLSPWLLLLGIFIIAVAVLALLLPRYYLITSTLVLSSVTLCVSKRSWRCFLAVSLVALGTVALAESVHWVIEKGLKPHQQNRIKALVDPSVDPLGIGWNVTQSKIAIGSGGIMGKGYLQGTQTKYGFVPEQCTDFIFCTVGEEHGWIGTALLVVALCGLITRILHLAERQRSRFARVYGYAVATILLAHFTINIGMTIGLMPVIGIPLPFISYGGSAMWSFSLMLFILLKLDAERKNVLFGRELTIE
ncbi:MAG: rod shape-determining protein RodA [Bacteroidota bacterium]